MRLGFSSRNLSSEENRAVGRVCLAGSVAVAVLLAAGPGAAQTPAERRFTRANDTRRIEFPVTANRNQVLAVDPHTHTVFSDGFVWPAVRVWEAEQDHLAAYVVTDHLEASPHKADLATSDKNRPYEIASKEAVNTGAKVHVVAGAELTRDPPWGHFNALFLSDVNALPLDPTMKTNPAEVLKAARAQGAFLVWNHPWATPGLDPRRQDPLPAEHRALLAADLLDGVEVANSTQYSAESFAMALRHDLAIMGSSDVHTLIDSDHQAPEGQHRTVTLVLAPDDSLESIREGLFQKRTAALYRGTLYGRERELSEIIDGSLRIAGKKQVESFLTKDVVEAELRNGGSIPFQLRLASASPFTSPRVVTVPAHGKAVIEVANVADMGRFALEVEVLNAFVDPQRNLTLTLR